MFDDRQVLAARADKPFEFNGTDSLAGVELAAIDAYSNLLIAKEVEANRIPATRASNESTLLAMLTSQRIDVLTMPYSSLRNFHGDRAGAQEKPDGVQAGPGGYTCHLMFGAGRSNERDDFNKVVRKMGSDPVWIAALASYDLKPSSGKAP